MLVIKDILLKVLPDRQVNLVIAILIGMIAAITSVAILNIAVWLVKGLFLLSEGGLMFYLTLLLVLIFSAFIGYFAWKKVSASSEPAHEKIFEGTRNYLREIEERPVDQKTDVSAEEQKQSQAIGLGKEVSRKSRVLDAMKIADASPTLETIENAEKELEEMSLDPDANDAWISSIRWELEQLKKRL